MNEEATIKEIVSNIWLDGHNPGRPAAKTLPEATASLLQLLTESEIKFIEAIKHDYGEYAADRAYENQPFIVIPVADLNELLAELKAKDK